MENLENGILRANNEGVIGGFDFKINSEGIYIPVNVIKSNGENNNGRVPLLITYECDIKIDEEYNPEKDPRIFLMAYTLRRYDPDAENKVDFLDNGGVYDFRNRIKNTLVLTPERIREDSPERGITELIEHMEKIKTSTTGYFPDYLIV